MDSHLEHGGEGALLKPWFWILWVAMSPVAVALFGELFLFYSV